MEDPTTIALNLTFFGTLGVAFFMFLGLFLVFAATLVLAGIGRLAAVVVLAVAGLVRGSPGITGNIGAAEEPAPHRPAKRPADRPRSPPPRPECSQKGTRAVPGVGGRRGPGRCPRRREGQGRGRPRRPGHRPGPAQPHGTGTGHHGSLCPRAVGHGHQWNTWRRPAGVQKAAHARSEVPAGHRIARVAARHSAGREGQTAGPGAQGRLSPYPGQASPLRWNPWNSDTSGTAASRFQKSRLATG